MYQTAAHPDPDRGREAPPPQGPAHDDETQTGGDAAAAAASLRLLVVDDAPDVTEMIALMMSYAGYQVATAFSATEALDAARTQQFDAVISDIGMPGMSGYQLAEALRALPAYRSTPLIAVTGFTMYEDRERAHTAGFDDFLHKPISPSALIAAVKRLCG